MLLKSEITQAITSQQQQLLSQQASPCKAYLESGELKQRSTNLKRENSNIYNK